MKLSERTVLITGGTSGIGLGLAEAFYHAKSKVIVCGRDKEKLTKVAEKLPGITTLQCDVSDAQQREQLAEEVLRRFPDLDILINNAGVQRYIDLKKGYEDFKSGENEIAINFVATVELTALFINHLMNQPSASIINVGSGLAFMPMTNSPIYCATKAAIHTYSLILRQQLKDTTVSVIEVVPPMVDTDLNKAGRDAARLKFRGVSLSEYIPTVIEKLEKDADTIYFGDGDKVVNAPRGEMENRLLNI